jgi:Mg-chelatase subunit ChlD
MLMHPVLGYAVDIYLADGTLLNAASPAPARAQPVLFVHGHNLSLTEPHYRTTWMEPLGTLPSFGETLAAAENTGLDIEPYFLNFGIHDRSIVEDARAIGEAVDSILQRHHDPAELPLDTSHPPRVRVVIIAYSKGTISVRLYLKSLQQQEYTLPPPRQFFHPVSEFIAISPPNHGLIIEPNDIVSLLFLTMTPGQQLSNGFGGANCFPLALDASVLNFMQNLNGHPMMDSHLNWFDATRDHWYEAPGSRAAGDPLTDGTLYVTLYDAADRDGVGGHTPLVNDCTVPGGGQQGRKLARNLAANAINMPVAGIPDTGPNSVALNVHHNTVHYQDVICKALYTAIHHRAPEASLTCDLTSTGLPIIPQPPQVALVLDMSGSMLAPACQGCASRLEVLQEAVEIFLRAWEQFASPRDQIGLSYFRTDIDTVLFPPLNLTLVPFLPHATTTLTDVQAQQTTPLALTAMGGGVLVAINTLQQPGNNRHIILFTDGMQNVQPLIQWNATQLQIAGPGSPTTVLDTTLGMRVHTIGVGAGQDFVGLLSDIAAATGGRSAITTRPAQDLRQMFIEQLVNALRGFSPQLVSYRHGTLRAESAVESFLIGHTPSRIVLKLSWPRTQSPLRFTVSKDGVDVTALGTWSSGSFYRFFTLDMAAHSTVVPGGTWVMQIEGRAGQRYEAAAIVHESALFYDLSLGARAYRVGDALQLETRVFAGARPLAGVARVTATVQGPRQSVATLLATRPDLGDPKAGPGEPSLSAQQQRTAALLQDPEALAAVGTAVTPLTLQEVTAGIYRATFPGTTVPGVYTVRFQIDGQDDKLGALQRTEMVSTAVRFGRAEAQVSDLMTERTAQTKAADFYTLRLRPRDAYGNYLGPGQADAVQTTLSSGAVVALPADLGDGTYLVPLAVPPGTDPTVTLYVVQEVLFHGQLSQLLR